MRSCPILSKQVLAQPFDLVGELGRAAVRFGCDPLEHRNPVFEPRYLVGELGIIAFKKRDFSISVGGGSMNRAAPFILDRIAVFRAHPRRRHPSDHRHGDDCEDEGWATDSYASSPCCL